MKRFHINTKKGVIIFALFVFIQLAPLAVFAATPVITLPPGSGEVGNPDVRDNCPGSFVDTGKYCLLAPLGNYFKGGVIDIRGNGLSGYLNQLYKIGVGVATALALVFITIGGLQYASTDSVTGTEHGKETIRNALVGLFVVLGSYVMLNAINPDLLNTGLNLTPVVAPQAVGANLSNIQTVDTRGNTAGQRVDGGYTFNSDGTVAYDGRVSVPAGQNNTAASGEVTAADQKVLNEIASGDSSCTENCFESAVAVYRKAGVAPSTAVFQNDNYIVGGTALRVYGTPRMPNPGEMVDMYTGYDKTDPFHTVIVNSDLGNGSYSVWDWHHNVNTGLRTVTFNLDTPGTAGYIGRVYTPQ